MEEYINFIHPTRCRDRIEFYKGRGSATIIIKDKKISVSCREIIQENLPLSKLNESVKILNDLGYRVLGSKEILNKYLSK